MNVLLNAVTPHLYWLGLWARKEWKWTYGREAAISQDALNNLTKGARWEVCTCPAARCLERRRGQ